MPADGGIKFGSYVLLRRIARGGMAEVFLAQQRGLEGFDRRVAVKRILPHLADTPDFVKMFLGEARLAAQLSHPNVVHIYDFGKVDNDYFIAMEYVEGVHAGQLFKAGERDKMPPTLVARVGADAANALHYAHELTGSNGKPLGLVHRDVSPANIMVSYDGIVKLCDFGIAKAASATNQLTNPGQVKGKYAYMSPEQTIASALDGRSDVFSLGICLWELLVGKTIVPRGDPVEAMRMIRDGKLASVSAVAPATPPPLAKAISWALETKREKRATAAELAQALEAFLKAAPELATSMQLSAYVRNRFPRDATGPMPAMGDGDPPPGGAPRTGMVASPGTAVAPQTSASILTPSIDRIDTPLVNKSGALIAASRLPAHDDLDGQETIAIESKLQDRSSQAELVDTNDPDEPTLKPGQRAVFTPDAKRPNGAAKPLEAFRDDDPTFDRDRDKKRAATPTGAPGAPGALKAPGSPKAAPGAPRRATPSPTPPAEDGPTKPRPASGPQRAPAVALPPPKPIARQATTARPHAADESTAPMTAPMVDVASPDAGTMIALPHSPAGSGADLDLNETFVASGARRQMVHNPGAIPTMSVSPLPAYDAPTSPGAGFDPTIPVRRAPPRRMVVIMVLVAITLFTFILVLATRQKVPTITIADAGVAISAIAIDAGAPDPDAVDFIPTFSVDASVAAIDAEPIDAETIAPMPPGTALLEVDTKPTGALVTIGDQRRTAPAKFALAPGKHELIAELPGWENEKREVELLVGEHLNKEIVFVTKLSSQKQAQQTGKLTIRTTPYSEVFNGKKKIGEAPFADIVMPVGTYTLTFKNPTHPTATKTVTIFAGKITKLSFALDP